MSTAPRTRMVTELGRQALSRAAHWHADHGFAVFPLAPGRKVPAVDNWEAAATTNHLAIARTWRRAPYNVGVATGPSGLVVVDLDQPKHPLDLPPEPWRSRGATTGTDVLALLTSDHLSDRGDEHEPVPTYAVTTPSRGRHLYYQQPANQQLGNSAGRIGWKIDTRGHGGYVVGAGSGTDAGRYLTETTVSPQPLPGWIIDALDTNPQADVLSRHAPNVKNADAYTLAALNGEIEKVLTAIPGQRNDTLNRAAFALGQLAGAQLLDHHESRGRVLGSSHRARRTLVRSRAHRPTAHRSRTHHQIRTHQWRTTPAPTTRLDPETGTGRQTGLREPPQRLPEALPRPGN
ncbi:bifunctional DNA primase/polymerase [Kribbella capetownensis]|uniref:Bifunctional DNA primase/polymerase n=1 Tax=Kribbella capetownensis TaxID=1572659 RepID=A0A4R0K314_9ACTN|nr:bifunctional DNA primase/polymerase [Kribbella capetownensis]